MNMQTRLGPWVLGLALAATVTLLVAAGKGKGLDAGGRTIVGPGSLTFPPETFFSETLASFNPALDVCVTLAGGNGDGQVNFVRLAGGSTTFNIYGGETVGFCETAVDRIMLQCGGTKSCSVTWRIDQMWP